LLQHCALFVQLDVLLLQTSTQAPSRVSQSPLQHWLSFEQNPAIVLGLHATQVAGTAGFRPT
jgi:hypothetical protein